MFNGIGILIIGIALFLAIIGLYFRFDVYWAIEEVYKESGSNPFNGMDEEGILNYIITVLVTLVIFFSIYEGKIYSFF